MDFTAFLVALVCGALGTLGLYLERDPRERAFLVRLFGVAFGLRVLFTAAFYATGLVNVLGGADDTIWVAMSRTAENWRYYGIDSLSTVYSAEHIRSNNGWGYFGSLFYYVIQTPSQMSLAFLNGFAGSVLVVVIYKTAREFFEPRACGFVAWIAAIMPGFLIWSALTVKETWLILFQISTFYAVWRLSRQHNPLFALFWAGAIALLFVLILGFRFYAAATLLVGIVITLFCCWSASPFRSAGFGVLALALLFLSLNTLGIFQFDLASATQSRIAELNSFRTNISDASQQGTGSAVTFDFDTTTPLGALAMLTVGSVYVLLSPFPWQVRSFGQAAALPDILLWWWLVFAFIIPGVRDCWARAQAVLLSTGAFVLPLLLFYSFIFGNVGLAYRQRAQLMPFMLLLGAAGYQKREREKARQMQQAALQRAQATRSETEISPPHQPTPA